MSASLTRRGHYRPHTLQLVRDLARLLPGPAQLRARVEGHYPGAALRLDYTWRGQTITMNVAARVLHAHYPDRNARRLAELMPYLLLRQEYQATHAASNGDLVDAMNDIIRKQGRSF